MTTIKIITFNLRGLKLDDIPRIMHFLEDHSIDIALFQETHIPTNEEAKLFTEAVTRQYGQWQTIWHNDHSKKRARGIAIWVRTSRETREDILITENSIKKTAAGRLLLISIRWSGHQLQLGNVYMPTASSANHWEQRRMVINQIARHARTTFICAGDWNMVEDPNVDSTSEVRQHNLTERSVVKFFQSTLSATLEEQHKLALQRNKVFTHKHSTANGVIRSRLDRFYASPTMSSYIYKETKTLETHNYGIRSDHKPVCLQILGKTPHHPNITKPQHMKTVKLAAKFDMETLEQAQREFQRRLSQIHDGIWTNFDKRIQMPAIERHTRIMQDYPKIKAALTKVWDKFSINAIEKKRRALQEAHDLQNQALEKECFQELEQCLQANRASNKICIPNDHMDTVASNLLKKPKQRSQIGMLINPDSGFKHTTHKSIANCLIKSIAAISKATDGSKPHQLELLSLITSEEKQIFPEHCDASATITTEEVTRALRRVRQSCPGDDGLKIEHYRKFKQWMAPILAELFTAMLHMKEMPKDFHNSTIRAIPKPGDSWNPQNYRPISLLNVDYRIFGFLLKERMTSSLQQLIPDTQTAFLPERQSAQNLWILQALQQRLAQDEDHAILAICDFRKAYDTINRPFLLEVCATLNLPDYMQQWIKMLLTQTKSRVFVNNCFSDYQYFEAGLRQGCPASPALYLLVGFLLYKVIQSSEIGIRLQHPLAINHNPDQTEPMEDVICLLQYADDSKVVLRPTQIPTFQTVMRKFALASGQHLNQDKTKLLPIGKLGYTPLPAQLYGYHMTQEAKILGVTFRSGSQLPKFDWQTKMATLAHQTDKLQKMTGLSTFAKYDLFNKFIISQILYAAEVVDIPDHIEDGLLQLARKLLPLGATCWTKEGQQSKAFCGGLGLLPLQEHLAARRAKWTLQLILHGTGKLWTRLIWNTVYLQRQSASSSRPAHRPVALSFLLNPPHLPNILLPSRFTSDNDEWPIADIIQSMLQGTTLPFDPPPFWESGSRRITVSTYTVKAGTNMFMIHGDNARQWLQPMERQAEFIHTLCRTRPTISLIARCKRQWWKAKVPNKWKEPAWHATIQGYMIDHVRPEARKNCGCGHRQADTIHHCRDCAIAIHIYGLLQPENLFPSTPSHFQQLLFNIWTNSAPPGFPPRIWTTISLITIYAIEIGRRTAYRLKYHPQTSQPMSSTRIIQKAQQEAEAFFWKTLSDRKATFPQGKEDTPKLPFLAWDHSAAIWRITKPHRWSLRLSQA